MAEGCYNGSAGSTKFDYRNVPDNYGDTCDISACSDEDVAEQQAIVKNLIGAALAQQK